MNKWLKILLSQNSLRKALGTNLYFKATKFDHHLQIIEKPNFQSILVLSPHPDDDVFGAGGLVASLAKAGAKINIAYLCDGAGGVKSNEPKNQKLVEVRKAEAQKAGEILGSAKQIFFGYPDGKLAAGGAAVKALSDLILEVKPDMILVPWFLDNHPDHRVANEILINAMVKIEPKAEIWAYEIWSPIFPNRIVPINAALAQKKEAIAMHASQLETRGYDKAILGLNQYRAEINGLEGLAEAFFAAPYEVYRKLYEAS